MASKSGSTQSDSPVAARAALQEPDEAQDTRAQEAKDQERQQREELKAGKEAGSAKTVRDRERIYNKGKGDRASLRVPAGGGGKGAQGGFVDNMSRRHDGDALEGHFVTIDLSDKDVKTALENVGLDEPTQFEGGYGVYERPGERDQETGYPVTAVVRLRGASNAVVTVPYESLSPSEAGHR